MSPEDPIRPFHAKDEARGQEAADAVAAVIKHAAERERAARAKKAPRKQPRWLLPVGVQLAVLAVYLLISPPTWVTVHPIQGPDSVSQEYSLRVAIYMQSQRIESYKIKTGRLPRTLDEIGASVAPGVEYRLTGDGYQLVGTNGRAALVYDSTESATDFLGEAASRLTGG
jgi:hypothetical protein